MQYFKTDLKNHFAGLNFGDASGELAAYLPDNFKEIEENRVRPSVLILPGGGYGFVSVREAEPIALQFLSQGYNAFVLNYSVAPDGRFPNALLQASAALALMRRNANDWHVDAEKLVVLGFSAGGHLAASVATKWNEPFVASTLQLAPRENRPNAAVLAYPVITSGEYANRESIENLLGADATAQAVQEQSLETCVTAETPPVFLWHTAEDDLVPVQNSVLFTTALLAAHVAVELHIFPKGAHGLSLASEATANPVTTPGIIVPHVQCWFNLMLSWLADTL